MKKQSFYLDLEFPKGKPDRPFIYSNKAFTASGYCISPSKEYQSFGGEADKQALHELRYLADAILWGAGTLRTDDAYPKLPKHIVKARKKAGKPAFPKFSVATCSGNLGNEPYPEGFFREKYPPIIFVAQRNYQITLDKFGNIADVRAVKEIEEGELNLHELVGIFHDMGIEKLLIEGGPSLIDSFLKQNLMDEIFRTITPKIFDRGKPTYRKARELLHSTIANKNPLELETISKIEAQGELLMHYEVIGVI